MSDENMFVDVWVGRFADESVRDAYFEECYVDEAGDELLDDTPVSQFCADMGESFIDHDFLAVIDTFGEPFANVLMEEDLEEDLKDKVIQAIQLKGSSEFDSVVMLFSTEFENPCDVNKSLIKLTYVGRFSKE